MYELIGRAIVFVVCGFLIGGACLMGLIICFAHPDDTDPDGVRLWRR